MSFSDIASRLRKHAADKTEHQSAPRDFDELYRLRARILGVLIRDARQAAGLSVEQCANEVNVSAETLTNWELGGAMPSLPQLELLAYHVNVPISHFWGTQTLQNQAQRRNNIQPDEYVLVRSRLIGALLRASREKAGLTPDQLAAEAGLSAGHIAAYELGQRPIPLPVLVTLAQVCRVNLAYFLEDGSRIGEFLMLQEDLKNFTAMPAELRRFVSSPVNQPYIEIAMRLSQMSTSELRVIAEAILNITL